MNKYSIGLPLELNKRFLKNFFKRNKNVIHDVYFSMIDEKKYVSRERIFSEDKKQTKKLIFILKYLNKININLEMVMNSHHNFSDCDFKKAKGFIIDKKIKIKTLCILNKDMSKARKYFNEGLCYSYNNNFRGNTVESFSKEYSEIVVGNSNIRNLTLIKDILSENKIVKILLNNGCSHNCSWCVKVKNNDDSCFSSWQNNVKKYGQEKYFSLTSVFPFEQFLYKDFFKKNKQKIIFKISSRSFDDCYKFESMIHNYKNNVNMLEPHNFKNFGIIRFYNTSNFNFERMLGFKKIIWEGAINEFFNENT